MQSVKKWVIATTTNMDNKEIKEYSWLLLGVEPRASCMLISHILSPGNIFKHQTIMSVFINLVGGP